MTAPRFSRRIAAALAVVLAAAAGEPGRAQTPTADSASIRLADLHQRAMQMDPRAAQPALLRSQSRLREANLRSERRPTVGMEGTGQYQSHVAGLDLLLPGGLTPPRPAHDSYDARLNLRHRLIDPTRDPRIAAERNAVAEQEARVATTLYSLRQAVNDAFFGALVADAQHQALGHLAAVVGARLDLAQRRQAEGVGLPSEAITLEAERMERSLRLQQLWAIRRGALDQLHALTGVRLDHPWALAVPDLGEQVRVARAALDTIGARPEFAQFARTRATLTAQSRLVAARDRPRVSAFARTGYGRPGLNPLGREFTPYALAGLQAEWSPVTWGTTTREREVIDVQRVIADTEEAAFRAAIRRAALRDLALIDGLVDMLKLDDLIVELRARAVTEAVLQHNEGAITRVDLQIRSNEHDAALRARTARRIELAEAQARFLTTLGLEVR